MVYLKGTAAQLTALVYELGQGAGERGEEQQRTEYLQGVLNLPKAGVFFAMTWVGWWYCIYIPCFKD